MLLTFLSVPGVLIPESRLPSLHRNSSQNFLKVQNSKTRGYYGTIEVFHHLHCLNTIRQYVHRDAYPADLVPWLFQVNTAEVAKEHVEHCIGTLREALMCNADLTPYLWFEGRNGGAAKEDFQAAHKCKDWESIIESVKKHAVELPESALTQTGHKRR